jgi:hypothetical protein
MLSIDGLYMLTNVVIVNSIQIDLVSRITLSHGIVVTTATQMKDGLYYNWFSTNMVLPFVVEVFGCLHQSRCMNFFINVPTWHENKCMNSFINVSTWHGEQRAMEALLQSCVHFIGKRC